LLFPSTLCKFKRLFCHLHTTSKFVRPWQRTGFYASKYQASTQPASSKLQRHAPALVHHLHRRHRNIQGRCHHCQQGFAGRRPEHRLSTPHCPKTTRCYSCCYMLTGWFLLPGPAIYPPTSYFTFPVL
jgi:hypothetical protein